MLFEPLWVQVQFQLRGCFRSEGPAVNSPDREGGETAFFNSPKARRADTNCGTPSALS